MYIFFAAAVLGFGLYEIFSYIVKPPSRKAQKAARRLMEKRGVKDDLYDFFIRPAAFAVSKIIHIDPYKKEKLTRDLERADIPYSPEMYYANAVTISMFVCVGALVFIPLGMKTLTFCVMFFAVLMFFRNIEQVKDKLKTINEEIKRELPRFVRMYNHSRGDNVQLLEIVEKYRVVAGEKFKYDLDLLIMDLKTTGEETALANFEARVNIPQLTNFVNILMGSIKGDDMSVALQLMEGEMRALSRENIRRIMNARPPKVKRAVIATGAMLIVMYLYVIGMDLINSLAVFN